MRFGARIACALLLAPHAAAAEPVVREERSVVVDGVVETWRLVWRERPEPACDARDASGWHTCPCAGFAFGESGERGEFRVNRYSLQGDHAHLIVEAHGKEALARGMKSIAARLARALNRTVGRSGPVLDGRYHHRSLRTPREVRRALAYVLLNARRHLAKRRHVSLDESVRLDPASSARWFDGWRRGSGCAEVDDTTTPEVARPHTWLLRVGWRRHGLVDPDEVPGAA